MKRSLAGLAFAFFTTSCAPPPGPDTRAADEAAIRALDEEWSRTAGAKNLDGTVAYYADGAYLLPPNAPVANTPQAIREGWAALLQPGTDISWKVTKVEVAKSGDLGYIVGTYKLAMKDAQGKPMDDIGKMVEVWKKQPDGNWKVVADVFNSDLPPAPAPEKKK